MATEDETVGKYKVLGRDEQPLAWERINISKKHPLALTANMKVISVEAER